MKNLFLSPAAWPIALTLTLIVLAANDYRAQSRTVTPTIDIPASPVVQVNRLAKWKTGEGGLGDSEVQEIGGNLTIPGNLTASQLVSSFVNGPPLVISSSVQVANLNASLLGGLPASTFGDITSVIAGSGLVGGAIAGDAMLSVSPNAMVRGITWVAGCDTCPFLDVAKDSQPMIYADLIGSMMLTMIRCYSDAGGPMVNLRKNGTVTVLAQNLQCSSAGRSAADTDFEDSHLSLDDTLDFVLVDPGEARRVTVVIKALVQ